MYILNQFSNIIKGNKTLTLKRERKLLSEGKTNSIYSVNLITQVQKVELVKFKIFLSISARPPISRIKLTVCSIV